MRSVASYRVASMATLGLIPADRKKFLDTPYLDFRDVLHKRYRVFARGTLRIDG